MDVKVRTGSIEEVVLLQSQIPEFEDPHSKSEYISRLAASEHIILIAEFEGNPVGFKVGYDRFLDRKVFYSWMGGVLPEHRGKKVARLLLQKMEVWCKLKGYKTLKFKTMNKHKAMIHFAVTHGFDIVDFEPCKPTIDSKIYFQKNI
ncbi:MAG: GNAT family N-acetyltransferase [Marinoscillum sp.]